MADTKRSFLRATQTDLGAATMALTRLKTAQLLALALTDEIKMLQLKNSNNEALSAQLEEVTVMRQLRQHQSVVTTYPANEHTARPGDGRTQITARQTAIAM